jgi:hypothetical protein
MSIMAAGRKRRKKQAKSLTDTITEMLAFALGNQEDFIIAFESGDDDRTILHVMTGKLITHCMLRKLTGQCEVLADEGSRHIATGLT